LTPLVAPEGERLPRISVVMASLFERVETLERCLGSLRAVEYPDFEVIVVDNRRVAEPVSIEGVRVVHEPRPGLSAARNRGLAEASGEIVAFTDDDVEVDPVWLLAIALRLRAHPEEVGVSGLIVPGELETPAQLAFEDYYGGFGPQHLVPLSHRLRGGAGAGAGRQVLVDALDEEHGVVTTFPLYAAGSLGVGANMAFRADVLRRLGGFDEALGAGTPTQGGEELAVFAQLVWQGHSLGFEPAALVRHSHRRDDDALRVQVEGWGRGFTAMLCAIALKDPGHIPRIAGVVPTWLRWVRSNDSGERRGRPPRPRQLVVAELAGMARGPIAYARSSLQQRRWRT
jgi:glycosyltransferase involved in cell wall biosynthesis